MEPRHAAAAHGGFCGGAGEVYLIVAGEYETVLRIIERLNHHPFWKRETAAGGRKFTVPTFDRWLYIKLHAAGLMGGDIPWFAGHIQPGMTVVDVGANIGYYTLVFADLVGPSGRVIAFEPDPELFGAAVENVRWNEAADRVQLHKCALGVAPDELHLIKGNFNSGDNRLRRDAGGTARSAKVRVMRLDDVIASEKVDWIKIDVQGWECDVFDGMGQTMARNRDTVKIYFEFWPHGIRLAGRDPQEAVAFLRRFGYSIYRRGKAAPVTDVELERYCRNSGRTAFINLLACPPVE
jgi:FkbM family methyltransferase